MRIKAGIAGLVIVLLGACGGGKTTSGYYAINKDKVEITESENANYCAAVNDAQSASDRLDNALQSATDEGAAAKAAFVDAIKADAGKLADVADAVSKDDTKSRIEAVADEFKKLEDPAHLDTDAIQAALDGDATESMPACGADVTGATETTYRSN
jgi:flagellar hook-basal body complex protein FliE